MEITKLELDGVFLIRPNIFRDDRGFFMERFKGPEFEKAGLPTNFSQDNHSRSKPKVIRGLHFQHHPWQGKLVSVLRGRIWDVVVDLRIQSPTFGKSLGLELSGDTGGMLWVPGGFAHGFCAIGSEDADVLYKVDQLYSPAHEGGIYWADPQLQIPWPVTNPIVSRRDQMLPSFQEVKKLLTLITENESRIATTLKKNGQTPGNNIELLNTDLST